MTSQPVTVDRSAVTLHEPTLTGIQVAGDPMDAGTTELMVSYREGANGQVQLTMDAATAAHVRQILRERTIILECDARLRRHEGKPMADWAAGAAIRLRTIEDAALMVGLALRGPNPTYNED